MKDILLDSNGDILLNDAGDIQFTDSVQQAISIRLKWFAKEWRLGPDFGIPYYEEVFIKNPSKLLLEQRMQDEIMEVAEVEKITAFNLNLDSRTRVLYVKYTVKVGEKSIEGKVELNV